MKIEQQVCNLELSKELKELGVKQNSLFAYFEVYPSDSGEVCKMYKILSDDKIKEKIRDRTFLQGFSREKRSAKQEYENRISAFTASELLEKLPESIDDKYLLEIGKENGEYIVYYVDRVSDITDYCFNKGQDDIDVDDKNLCNALAKMLIYLKENNLIKN